MENLTPEQDVCEAVMPEAKKEKKIKLRLPGDEFFLKLLAFVFPFLAMITAFAVNQLYPIGDRTMLTVDLYHQYAPFLYEFRQKLVEGRSLFYSWNCGLGNEYFAAFANYDASPLNLFVVFFTPKAIPVFIALVTAVRAGLSSLFMSMYLSDNDEGRYDYITVIFGSSYALCGWFLSDFWNIMWCDAVVLLPLIMLGLNKLLRDGRYTLYIASLALSILCNYYTGFFTCLFLIFWAPVTHFVVNKHSVKSFFVSVYRFALASLSAGMISAATVLPTYLILQHSSATGSEFPVDFNLTGNMFDFLGRLFVAANPNIRDGMANVSCGVMIMLLMPLFFLAPKETGISKSKKIGYGITLAVLYLSFSNRMLDFIWHGFHFPNQIPYRESFLMSFVLVLVAFNVIRKLRKFPASYISGAIAGSFIFLVLFEKFGSGAEGYIQIGLTLLFVIIQGAVLTTVHKGGKKSPLFYELLITITVMAELLVACIVTVSTVASHEGFTNYDFYGKNRDIIKNYAEQVEGTPGHNNFERTEIYPNNICDIQSVYDVKGMSIFSSTARESFVKYMRNFGFHNNGINGLRNSGLTRVSATLLGLRNFVTIENTSTVPKIFDLENSDGEVMMYGNPDALNVGYMVSEDFLNYSPDYAFSDVFAKNNEWVRSMGVEADVFLPIEVSYLAEDNIVRTSTAGNGCNYTVTDPNSPSSFTVNIFDAEYGSDVYIYAGSSKGGTVHIVCGETDEDYTYEIRSYQIIPLGRFEGHPITATVNYGNSPSGTMRFYAYQLNRAGYARMVAELSDEQLIVSDYDDTGIRGSITANSDGLLLLTIPYAEGFMATVDGKPAEILPVQDALCALKLEKGTHDIEIKYIPAGFDIGLAVSITGLAAGILLSLMGAGKFKRKIAPVVETSLEVEHIDENVPEQN